MFRTKARPTDPLPENAEPQRIWIDLLNPDAADHERAELDCGLRLPDRAALSEIESSSRHYQEGEATYLSAALMHGSDTDQVDLTPVGFILAPRHLVTVRFEQMKAFDAAARRLADHPPASPLDAFTALIEEIVDRKADVLEAQGAKLAQVSSRIFSQARPKRRSRASDEMRRTLTEIGRAGTLLGRMRASLLTIHRIVSYVVDESGRRADPDIKRRLQAAVDDIHSLTGFSETLNNKVQFLLDAVLGFINIDQNDVIKVLTVVSVVGVPPTLVASWYGMNFKHMPELEWAYGYPYAFTLLVLSVVVPLVWLKVRGWF